ncbi:MAG TPA: hypothetical protein VF067_03750 [Sphingomicrobium sp.]
MTAVLGTLSFLATLWLLVVLGARVLEESGAKIAAALQGKPVHRPVVSSRSVRIRIRRQSALRCAEPRWRAAA